MEELVSILSKFVSPDRDELQQAENYLRQAAQNNLPSFLTELSNVIGREDLPVHIRMAAGLELKNHLTSKDANIKTKYQEIWIQIPPNIRELIKQNILKALHFEGLRPSSAAQCIAYISAAELPKKQSPEIITTLANNITQGTNVTLVEGSLEAVGYICQEIDSAYLLPYSNVILTAIIHGMNHANNHIKLAATTALLNSLEFIHSNFEQENERNYIMQVVCEATQSSEVSIQVCALQCLVKIMQLYYEYMETYMNPALFPISLNAMKSDREDVALQGIEFWSTVCDEEIDLIALNAQDPNLAQNNTDPSVVDHVNGGSGNQNRILKFYAKGALPFLLPILTETLTKQDESGQVDDEEWIPSKAASVCLSLLASVCGDEIVGPLLPFIKDHLFGSDWRAREASIMAFGCMMEGPSPELLKPIVEQALPHILPLLKDSVLMVRDTASWTIGRICEQLPHVVLTPQVISPVLTALLENLSAEPKIVLNICWALTNLAENAYVQALPGGPDSPHYISSMEPNSSPQTFILSPMYETIVGQLLACSERNDGSQTNLKGAVFQAIADFLKYCPLDCYETLLKVTSTVLESLKQTIQMASNALGAGGDKANTPTSDLMNVAQMLSYLCLVLQSSIRKLKEENLMSVADIIMLALLQILSLYNASTNNVISPTLKTQLNAVSFVQEDVLLTISTLIVAYGEKFMKYWEMFFPFLLSSLAMVDDTKVCLSALMVVMDLYQTLQKQLVPYTEPIFTALIQILANPNADKMLKPHIFECLSTMVILMGPAFAPYAPQMLNALIQASRFKPSPDAESVGFADEYTDEAMIDFVNTLRESCVSAFSGIINGFSEESTIVPKPITIVEPYIPNIVAFIDVITLDPDSTNQLLLQTGSLLGDLCNVFGAKLKPKIEQSHHTIEKLCEKLRRGKHWTNKQRENIAWILKQIRIVLHSS